MQAYFNHSPPPPPRVTYVFLALKELGWIWFETSDPDIYITFQASDYDTDRLLLAERAIVPVGTKIGQSPITIGSQSER